jgi:hypothetical protein
MVLLASDYCEPRNSTTHSTCSSKYAVDATSVEKLADANAIPKELATGNAADVGFQSFAFGFRAQSTVNRTRLAVFVTSDPSSDRICAALAGTELPI